MAQDFWASSGYRLLAREGGRLQVTDAWLTHLLRREELVPPAEAGPRERALHARLLEAPRTRVRPTDLDFLEDPDARDNWRHFLAFRDAVLAAPSVDHAYASLFRGDVTVAPVFVDLLAQLVVRDVLEGEADPWLARAGEFFFRLQRVSTESNQALSADASTMEAYAENPQTRMEIMSGESAPFYFLRDELYSFLLDITPGTQGSQALAHVLERWIARMLGVEVAITPVERIADDHWRWHVGLDAESTAILNALYHGEKVDAARLERLVLLFRLEFRDPMQAAESARGRPVYLGLACREDRTLRMKPQNLLSNLPLSGSGSGALR